jgi:hypothetical protein
MPVSDDEIDYLLSGGGLGGEQLERIRGRLTATARARARARAWRRTMLAVTAAGVVAAAAAAVVLVPRAMTDHEAMRAKGAGRTSATPASLHVACLSGALSACPRGSVLGFSVGGSEGPGFVTAFADPVEGAGDRIWYFLDQPLASTGDSRVLASGARVGREHTARRYRIHLLLSPHPLGRERAAATPSARDVVAHDTVDLEVIP